MFECAWFFQNIQLLLTADYWHLGNEKLIDLLTEKGLDSNAKDLDGNTPILLAATSGNEFHIQVIL